MADTAGFDPEAAIAALRARGAEAFDPVRFRFIEALARRAAALEGEARRLLYGKLATALAAYGEGCGQAQGEAGTPIPAAGEPGGLRELVARLAGQYGGGSWADGAMAPQPGDGGPAADAGPRTELKSVRYFRTTWSKLSVDQQLAQALAQGPKNAGPLNSHGLVLQALKLMRDAAPDYLNRFMSYADTLLWLEQAGGGGAPAPKNAGRGDGDRKRKSGRGRSG